MNTSITAAGAHCGVGARSIRSRYQIQTLVAAASRSSAFSPADHLINLHQPEQEHLAGVSVAERLRALRELVILIAEAIAGNSTITIGELLQHVYSARLLILDPRLISYLDPEAAPPAPLVEETEGEDDQEEDESAKEMASMDAFLRCPAKQLMAYETYISERSPFGTQQGIKGAEFDRVLVVLDDEESTHVQFSYEKYLGLKKLSERDLENLQAGEETTVDRTRRLFYVSCTRALKDLAVVLFTVNPTQAEAHIRTLHLFENDAIHTTAIFRA